MIVSHSEQIIKMEEKHKGNVFGPKKDFYPVSMPADLPRQIIASRRQGFSWPFHGIATYRPTLF